MWLPIRNQFLLLASCTRTAADRLLVCQKKKHCLRARANRPSWRNCALHSALETGCQTNRSRLCSIFAYWNETNDNSRAKRTNSRCIRDRFNPIHEGRPRPHCSCKHIFQNRHYYVGFWLQFNVFFASRQRFTFCSSIFVQHNSAYANVRRTRQ